MGDPSTVSWVPQTLFVVLALWFLQKAIRSRASRTWGWGRVGGKVPLSRTSYFVCGVAFLVIAAVISSSPHPPSGLAILLVVSFIAIVVMGLMDTRAYRRSHSGSGRDRER